MIYVDTHVIVWLYEGLIIKLSNKAQQLIEQHELVISPAVYLELQYLHEIKRVTCRASDIIEELTPAIGLSICDTPFIQIVKTAAQFNWTRDPFDRFIVAAAQNKEAQLLTKDRQIKQHYIHAIWE